MSDDDEEKTETTYDEITWVSAHPDGRWIAVGDMSGRILVWEPGANRIVAKQKLEGRVRRVEWTSDGERLLAIVEGSDAVNVLSSDASRSLRTIATGHGDVMGLGVHPSKARAATTGDDGHVRIWDLESGASLFERKASSNGYVCALSETHVAVGTDDGQFDVWDLATEKDVAGGEVFAYAYVGGLAFSPDGKWLVMGGSKGRLVLLEVAEWKCTHTWKGTPPKPIATNDIRWAPGGKTWVAAHSDDTASFFDAPAAPFPKSLGFAFYVDRKPWDREYIVSSACFVPHTKMIVTGHFTGRLRLFAEVGAVKMRVAEVAFDPKTDAPVFLSSFGDVTDPIAWWNKNAQPSHPPERPAKAVEPKKKPEPPKEIAIGDREHRARSIAEMQFAASLHPCVTCGAAPKDLGVSGEGDTRALRGKCAFCGTPAAFTFVVEGDPAKMRPKRHEVGDDRPSTMIEPRALTAELERLTEIGIDDGNRERALTCIVELLKFPLIRDGERGDALRGERDRLLADVKEPLIATPNAQGERVRYAPGFDAMTRALFFEGVKPNSFGFLEETFGIRIPGLEDALKVLPGAPHERTFDGLVTKLVFVLHGSLYFWHRDHAPLRDRPLSEWTITMQHGAAEILDALRRAYGPPRPLPSHHVYGEKWSVATRGHAVQLGWYDKLPDWAVPPIDPAVRERALVDLARRLHADQDSSALTRIGSWLPHGCGIVPKSSNTTSVSLELAPAMKALDLFRILGWRDVFAVPHGVHGEIKEVQVPVAGGKPGEGSPPAIGRWRIVPVHQYGPSGPEVAGAPFRPGGSIRHFGSEDLVQELRIVAP